MTDSGSTNFPTGPKLAGRDIPDREPPRQSVDLVRLPERLKAIEHRAKIKAEVIRQNRDGTVTLRTRDGDYIDVRPSKDQPPPKMGDQVEIRIEPGRPPKQATIQKTAAQNTNAVRNDSTPVEVNVRPANTGQTQQAEQPQIKPPTSSDAQVIKPAPLPPAGSTVHMQPLPPKEALAYIAQNTAQQAPPLMQMMSALVQAPITQAATLSAQSAQIDISSELQRLISTPISSTAATIETLPIMQLTQAPINTEAALTTFESLQVQLSDSFPTVKLSAPNNTAMPTQTVQANLSTLPSPSVAQTLTAPPALSDQIGTTLQTPLTAQERFPLDLRAPITARIEALSLPNVMLVEDAKQASILEALQQSVKDIPAQRTDGRSPEPPLAPLSLQTPRAESLQAFVTGLTDKNLPILSFFSPQGEAHHFALHSPTAQVTPGAQVQITPLPEGQMMAPINTAPLPLSSYFTPGPWPAMQDVQQALAQATPAMAQAMSNMTPNLATPTQMPTAALFFMAAMRGGDLQGWLGDKALETLRRSERGQSALTRLLNDGQNTSRFGSEPISQDWRAMSLPFAHQDEMHRMALFFRQEQNSEEQGQSKGRKTRFIFDLDLTRMGPVQIDGLFNHTRLDVIVRTEEPFSMAMQAQMRRLYADALRQTQVTGDLSFQNQPESWVKINIEEHSHSIVVA